jgi:hypothetical protein
MQQLCQLAKKIKHAMLRKRNLHQQPKFPRGLDAAWNQEAASDWVSRIFLTFGSSVIGVNSGNNSMEHDVVKDSSWTIHFSEE